MGIRARLGSHALAVLMALAAAARGGVLQEDTWYEDKARKGANLHDILREHKARAAAKQSALKDDLTALLQKDPELYELEKDHRFKRWLEFVEPRVSPSGDLSLLDRGQEEIAALVPLDGEARPAAYGTWEPIGPYSEGTNGAGRLNWVEFHPQDTSAMMVGSPSGGVWFTRDGGKTWTTPTDKIAILGAAWAAYHPTRPDTIYLGTGDGYHGDTKSIGVLRSTDGGKTWGRTGLEFPITGSTQIVKLVTDPRNPDKLFVAASNGVYVSLDGGATFTKSTGITGKVWDLEIHPGNPDIVYASTAAFHRSTDGGKTFSAVAGATSTYRMLIGVTPAEPSWVYLLRGSRSATEGVELSIDDGLTFARKGTGAEIGCSQAWYDYALAVNPDKADDLAAGCLRVFRSGDGGTAWTQAGASYHVDIQGLAFRRDGALFAVTDGGIYRATGRSTWQSLNNNLNIGQSYRLGVDRHDYDRVCTGRQDNGTDFRDGGEFRRALGGDGFECFWNNTGTRFFGASQNGTFSRCDYANGQLSGCTSVAPAEAGAWNTPWSHDVREAGTLYAGRAANMWKSVDNGSTWTQMGTVGGSGSIRDFAVAPSNSQVLYVLKGSDVRRTVDGGQAWTSIKGTLTGTPVSLAVSSLDADDLWITVSGYTATAKVWHSTNGGQTWVNETRTGLPNLPCNTVALDDAAGGVYVGMDVGVYYKNRGQPDWQSFSAGLPNASVRELEIAQKGQSVSDRRILAATFGRGVWRAALWDKTPTVSAGDRAPVPRRLSVFRSGQVLKVRFLVADDRPAESSITLRLHAADGVLLHKETLSHAGIFERDISFAGRVQGIYWLILESPAGRVSRRIALY